MSGFYGRFALIAVRLMGKYGQTVFIKRTDGISIDPVTGVESGTESVLTTTGILKIYPDNLIDGTRITSGNRLLVLTSEVEPLITDKVSLHNEDWNIEEIQTVSPAGADVVYMVKVGK